MKTALERIFEKHDKEFDKMNFLRWLSGNRKSLLEAEKEQITTTYAHGMAEGITFEITNSLTAKTPEQYYNLTYKSDE